MVGTLGSCDARIFWFDVFFVGMLIGEYEGVCLRERERMRMGVVFLFGEIYPSPHCDIPGQQHYNPVTLTSVVTGALVMTGVCDCYHSPGGIDCPLFINL